MNRRRRIHTAAALLAGGLLLGALAGVAAAGVGTSSRGAFAASSSGCAALPNVRAFHGMATLGFDETANGADPGVGTETIALARHAEDLKIDLIHKGTGPGTVIFTGTVSGGQVLVDDTFLNTGTKFKGHLGYAGASNGFGSFATLTISGPPLVPSCEYLLQVSFGVQASFSGDSQVQPDTGVGGAAYTGTRPVPSSLQLSGGLSPDAYGTCQETRAPSMASCYQFGGGWTVDFEMLAQCHKTTADSCAPSDKPTGTGAFSWTLSPTYANLKSK